MPLHCAALAGSLECARLLIERGASTSSVSKSGRWGFLLHSKNTSGV